MKCLAFLSFTIATLIAPIQTQAADQSEEALAALRMFMERQAQVAQTLQNLADMRHQRLKAVADSLRAEPQNQQYPDTNCVPFTQNSDPEAEVRYLTSHPGARVCPGPNPDLAGQAGTVEKGMRDMAIANERLRCSMSGRIC